MKVLFIIIGLLLSSLALADNTTTIKPASIAIANDDQAKIILSNQDINRLFVVKDKISSLNAPNNRVMAHNDQSGSIFMNVIGKEPFTAFITTQKGRHFSLFVLPKSEPGVTVRFLPKTKIIRYYRHHTVAARRFEHSSAYEETLVNLLRDVMLSQSPPGYTAIAPSAFNQVIALQLPKYLNGRKFLKETVSAGYLGGELAVRVVRVTNSGKQTVRLIASDFYTPGVRAVAIGKETLGPHESTNIYEVTTNA